MSHMTISRTAWMPRKALEDGSVKAVWFAPPCGTASAAREIRRKNKLGQQHWLDPKPLRSEDHPDGLPSLTGTDSERVRLANLLYRFASEAVPKLVAMRIAWAIENPTSSRMSNYSSWRLLPSMCSKLLRPRFFVFDFW